MVEFDLEKKFENLKRSIAKRQCMAVAFSGGVDSTFLLAVAHEVLGDKALAITVHTQLNPASEYDFARDICQMLGVEQVVIDVDALSLANVASNPPDRCYWCKHALFTAIVDEANRRNCFSVVDGTNADDSLDYRPGERALDELGIESPLSDANLTKNDIRMLSREMDLPTWDKPALACLASRFPYGEHITEDGLRRVEEAESYLHALGFRQVRVRVSDKSARIETLPQDFSRVNDDALRSSIVDKFKDLGFTYISLDLQGYRTGSLNEVL